MKNIRTTKETKIYFILTYNYDWDTVLTHLKEALPKYSQNARLLLAVFLISLLEETNKIDKLIDLWEDNYPMQKLSGYNRFSDKFPVDKKTLKKFLKELKKHPTTVEQIGMALEQVQQTASTSNNHTASFTPELMVSRKERAFLQNDYYDRGELDDRHHPFR